MQIALIVSRHIVVFPPLWCGSEGDERATREMPHLALIIIQVGKSKNLLGPSRERVREEEKKRGRMKDKKNVPLHSRRRGVRVRESGRMGWEGCLAPLRERERENNERNASPCSQRKATRCFASLPLVWRKRESEL